MASLTLVFILVVCLAVFHRGIDSEATTAAAVPVHETCTVSTVTEGEPAVMTFKLRSGIDTTSTKFFAHLRRKDRKLTDIVTCDGVKVACDVKDGYPMFHVDNIQNNILTVEISNMSRELENTYVLQVYFNGTPEPVISCTLNITYTQTTANTVTGDENVIKGWIPALIFGLFLLLMIGIGLLFWKKYPDRWQKCRRRLPFKADQNQHKATSKIPDEEEHGETKPTDPLLTTQQPQNPCPPSNKNHDEPDTPRSDDQGQQQSVREKTPQRVPPQEPGNTSLLSEKNQDKQDTPRSDDQGQQKSVREKTPQRVLPPNPGNTSPPDKPPIGREQINAHRGMRWFVKNLSEVEVDNLFKCAKPRAGCFVITQTDSSSFILAVCWKGQGHVDRYYIDQNDSGFTLNNTKEQFKTLCELVSHYKTTPIRVGETDLGKLSKPCEEEPIKYAWYFGSLNAAEVEKLLLTKHTEEGSFLVTKNVTDEDKYSLSVKFGGKFVPFTIVSQDDGFKINPTKSSFRTLQELVENYHKKNLDGRGKLTTPLEIIPEKLTKKEKQILEKHGPGSFFFKDSSIPGRRVLAVNVNGKMKQLMIIKSNDGYKLAGILHTDEAALELYYRTKEISQHGDQYGYLRKNCTHDLEKN